MARQSRKRTMRRMRGGNYTTSSWGQAVYGGPGQQQAVQGSNVIATKDPESMSMPMVQKNGGGIVTDVALPAALIFARNSIGTRRFVGTPRRSRRNRRRGTRRRR
jgi:hypothetical protein